MSNAAEMVFTGELIDAAKALETGLVSQVVEPDELMNAAKAMADRIAANARAAPLQEAAAGKLELHHEPAAGTLGGLQRHAATHRRPPRAGRRPSGPNFVKREEKAGS